MCKLNLHAFEEGFLLVAAACPSPKPLLVLSVEAENAEAEEGDVLGEALCIRRSSGLAAVLLLF